MAGANPANADGLTFNWTGAGNGTSFGRSDNYGSGYDADGNQAQDADGDSIPGPPNGLDNMIVTSGTPTVSSGTRRILSLDLSGGQFIVRNSSKGGPSTFFVDGTLNLSGSGALNIGADERGASVLSVDTMVMTGGIVTEVDAPGILTITNSLSQSGGDVSQVTINTPSYALSGGTLAAPVNFTNLFSLSGTGTVESAAKLTGSDNTSAMTQSGGIMNGVVTGIGSYTQSGGSLGGSVTTGIYDLNDATATSSGTITASDTFALEPESGTAMVDARLSGTGALVKSGNSTVVLTGSNDFTGTVSINAGTLEVQNGAALADTAAVTIADTAGAKLLVTTSETIGSLAGGPASTVTIADGQMLTTGDATNTAFMGAMDGETGSLTKEGSGTFTLGGDIMLGGLLVNNGELAIGTGTSTNTASFESATVAAGATLYVASGATLTIRIPNNLINNGHLINDGTIVDDLDNNSVYDNHADNIADVASNTSVINNDTPDGFWTGNVLTNAGIINNYNIWTGDVVSNQFPSDYTYRGVINNYHNWTGDILSNNFLINNNAGATWTGDVIDNDYNIANAGGTWIGDVKKNSDGTIFNDGATAVWTGDVLTNDSQIVNTNGATWNGKVESNNNTIFNLAGSAWNGEVVANGGGSNGSAQIDNYGAWTGAVNTNAGWIFNLAGSWTGNVLANTGLIVNNDNDENTNPAGANHAVWTGDISSNDGQITNDHGGTWTGNILGNNDTISNQTDATWNGDVVANGGGSNHFTMIDNYGAWTGAVNTNAGVINNYNIWTGDIVSNQFPIDYTYTGVVNNYHIWNGDVLSNDFLINNNAGSTWTGNVLANTGLIDNDHGSTWTGDVLSNDGTIDTTGVWNGDFTSAGTVNAENRINGAFDNSGVLQLTGSLSGITTLTNSGTLDMRNGSAAQTLTAASASFGANSFFNIDVDATGKSDRVVVTGAAALAGTVQVTVMSTAGPYDDTTRYTILTADSITGTFAHVTTDLAFLVPRLSYDDGDVDLTLMRNDHGFAYAGVTRNQKAAAGAAELLGASNEIYDAVLWLKNDQAQHAFDDLSGEAYSSVASAFVQNASVVADVVTRRIDQAFDRGSAIGSCAGGLAPAANPKCNTNLWGQFYGVHGNLAGDGGTAGIDLSTGGFAGGIDGTLGDWRSGVMVQAGGTSTRVSGLGSSSDSNDYGAGIYGGRQWGNTRLSLGAIYTRHDFRATRDVAFAGFTDDLSATYSAGAAQAFGKLSQEFDFGALALRPYASLDYVNHDSDGFAETGGAAALNSASNVVDATFTTLGLGVDREFLIGDGMLLTAKGSLGWRHAFADTPSSDYRFADGTSFSIVGAPIASDTAVVSAGLNLDVNLGNTFVVGYEGQIGDGTEIHALEGVWSIQF